MRVKDIMIEYMKERVLLMKSIRFIVPYFGKFPDYFKVWLETCRVNDSISWLVFTDDKRSFDYPKNVEVIYKSFEDIKKMSQDNYDFEISLNTPYKLCDYKIAYGEIFHKYLKDYDFWGFCDIDLIWGDIRAFFTEDVLEKNVKIGCQGHSTIFRNLPEINSAYRTKVDGCLSFEESYKIDKVCCTDVGLVSKVFDFLKLPVHKETVYAGLQKYDPAFYLQAMPKEEGKYNYRQVFLWEKGKLTRYYLDGDIVRQKDFLYIHFFNRPMKNKISNMDRILIYPDCYLSYYDNVDIHILNKYGKKSKVAYYFRVIKQNRKRIRLKKVISYFQTKMYYEQNK